MKARRKELQQKRSQEKFMRNVLIASGVVLVAVIAAVVFARAGASNGSIANPGRSVQVMAETNHVPEGTNPGPYNTDPPTSGKHYDVSWSSAFYEEDAATGMFPEGHLVHSLEHGYVIFWYNCTLLDEQACADTKAQIRQVMDAERANKVIAFPWPSTQHPVVMTSWGRIFEMDTFDPEQARAFVQQNRNKAPEPHAD